MQKAQDIISILSNQNIYSDFEFQIYPEIAKATERQKQNLVELLKRLMHYHPSHLITGTYTMDNIITRPENTIIIVDKGKMIFNVNSRQIMILGSNPSEHHLSLVVDLIRQIGSIFCFVSGVETIDHVSTMDYDNKSDNIVFKLEELNKTELEKLNDLDYKLIDIKNYQNNGYSEEENIAFALATWNYDAKSLRNLSNPHIAAVNNKKEAMGGARANAISNNYAVVGGVRTLKAFRKKGVGTAVSIKLVEKLTNMVSNVVLETDVGNHPAIKIYEKIGFERVSKSAFFDFGTSVIEEIRGDRDY